MLEAMRVMQERHVRHLPVTVDGHAVGVISIRDFLGAELDEIRGEHEQREKIWES